MGDGAQNYANTAFQRGLDQINTSNVGQLQVAWTFSVGKDRGHEAAPLYSVSRILPENIYGHDLALHARARLVGGEKVFRVGQPRA